MGYLILIAGMLFILEALTIFIYKIIIGNDEDTEMDESD
jgi:hypothetical protein